MQVGRLLASSERRPHTLSSGWMCAQRDCLTQEGSERMNQFKNGHINTYDWVNESVTEWSDEQMSEWVAELHRSSSGSSLFPRAAGNHRGLRRVTKMRTLRMAMRRSLREVMARMVSWARFSNGRTASSHQHQAGPLGLACRREQKWTAVLRSFHYSQCQKSCVSLGNVLEKKSDFSAN